MKKKVIIIILPVIIALTALFIVICHSNNLTLYIQNASYHKKLNAKIYMNDKLVVDEDFVWDKLHKEYEIYRFWEEKDKNTTIKVIVENEFSKNVTFKVTNNTKVFIFLGGEDLYMKSDESIGINVMNNCKICPKTFFNFTYY